MYRIYTTVKLIIIQIFLMNNFILDKQNSINCLKKVLQALKLYFVCTHPFM